MYGCVRGFLIPFTTCQEFSDSLGSDGLDPGFAVEEPEYDPATDQADIQYFPDFHEFQYFQLVIILRLLLRSDVYIFASSDLFTCTFLLYQIHSFCTFDVYSLGFISVSLYLFVLFGLDVHMDYGSVTIIYLCFVMQHFTY